MFDTRKTHLGHNTNDARNTEKGFVETSKSLQQSCQRKTLKFRPRNDTGQKCTLLNISPRDSNLFRGGFRPQLCLNSVEVREPPKIHYSAGSWKVSGRWSIEWLVVSGMVCVCVLATVDGRFRLPSHTYLGSNIRIGRSVVVQGLVTFF